MLVHPCEREESITLPAMETVNERVSWRGANPRPVPLAFGLKDHRLMERATVEHHDQGVGDFALDFVELELESAARSTAGGLHFVR